MKQTMNEYDTKLYDEQLIMIRIKDHDPISALDIFVAKQSVTIPKYLIAITNFLKA